MPSMSLPHPWVAALAGLALAGSACWAYPKPVATNAAAEHQPERSERPNRPDGSERPNTTDRSDRSERAERAERPEHWSYEGDHGPEAWGTLSPEFEQCAMGSRQSPIDISQASTGPLGTLQFDYRPTMLDVINNGHTIQVNYGRGSALEVDGDRYELRQFHFHTPSEHTVEGSHFAMEMHLVHGNARGELAVVGILVTPTPGRSPLDLVFEHLPEPGQAPPWYQRNRSLNVLGAFPSDRSYFQYEGSLTTPPCTEGVRWFVLRQPIPVDARHVASIRQVMHDNNRPTQPLNDRSLVRQATPE